MTNLSTYQIAIILDEIKEKEGVAPRDTEALLLWAHILKKGYELGLQDQKLEIPDPKEETIDEFIGRLNCQKEVHSVEKTSSFEGNDLICIVIYENVDHSSVEQMLNECDFSWSARIGLMPSSTPEKQLHSTDKNKE